GQSQGRKHALTVQIVYRDRRDYWMNAVVPAMLARMLAQGQPVRRGVHFLADAVDPVSFMAALKQAAVIQADTFDSFPSQPSMLVVSAIGEFAPCAGPKSAGPKKLVPKPFLSSAWPL